MNQHMVTPQKRARRNNSRRGICILGREVLQDVLQKAPRRNGAQRGLIEVYTGPGKGKTTAALGLALRATGHGLRAIMIRFSRCDFQYGEDIFVSNCQPFEIVQLKEKGNAGQSRAELYSAVQEAFAYAERVLIEGSHDVLILDDIFGAIDMALLNVEHVMHLIRIKPPWLELILTGLSAPREVQKQADLVTQMLMIKHPFYQGIEPREGIDY